MLPLAARLTRQDWLTLLLIVFVATLTRFSAPLVVDYFHDDGMLATLAQELVTGRAFHWTGILSSTGIPNAPMSVYVLALPFAIRLDPLFAIACIMAWNVVGVAVLWWGARRYAGRRVALLAGLAYAVSPWAALYSRKLWAQDYHTPFILLGLLCMALGYLDARLGKRGQAVAQVAAWPLLCIGLQIHFAAWALAPLILLMLWRGRRAMRWPATLAGGGLALLLLVPFGVGIAQTLQSDPNRLSDAAARSANFGLTLAPLEALLHLTMGSGMGAWLAPDQVAAFEAAVPPSPLWVFLAVLLLIGVGVGLWQREKRAWTLGLLLWAGLPPMLLIPNWTATYPHYFIASIPALMLLMGQGAASLAQLAPAQPYGRSIVQVAFVVLLITQGMAWQGVLRYLDGQDIRYPGFTTPLSRFLPIRDALSAYTDVVVVAKDSAWDREHEAVIWDTLLRGQGATRCVGTVAPTFMAYPPHGYAVLIAPETPADHADRAAQLGEAMRFPTRVGGGVYRLIAVQPSAPAPDVAPLARFANGVALLNARYAEGVVTTLWRTPAEQRGADVQLAIQAFDATGGKVAQADGRFWQGAHWCEGWQVSIETALALPAEAQELRISLYRSPAPGQFNNLDLLDAADAPIGQQAIIPLVPS